MTESNRTGTFVWRELVTPDFARAKAFYGELFGWAFDDVDMGAFKYPMIRIGERMLGGLVQQEKLPSSQWVSYVAVDDVDRAAKIAAERGGTIAHGPGDIPNVGRFAIIEDPEHARLTLFKSSNPEGSNDKPPVGAFCWETLITGDVERAKEFYGAVIGWKTTGEKVPVFTFGETWVADIQQVRTTPPAWQSYVVVEDNAATNERAVKLGGQVVIPKIPVPNFGTYAKIADPMGAFIGTFQPNKP